mgnify:CR=1 FL=1
METENKFSIEDTEIKFFSSIFLFLVILLLLSLLFGLRVGRRDTSLPGATTLHIFPVIEIEAQAAYVYDVRTKTVLFAKNENERLSLASLTKVMAALVAAETTPTYSTIVIGQDAIKAEGDSGLRNGERWSLKNLLDFSLVSSSNDGMSAVALALGALEELTPQSNEVLGDFVLKMNEKASELDLKNTYFFNITGLDETAEKGGAYGTAKDMTMLFDYILSSHNELLEATKESVLVVSSLNNVSHKAKNTNLIVNEIPGLIASKTGYTDIGGGNLVVAFDPELGRPIIVTILGSSEKGRFEDMTKLVSATMEYITGELTTNH